MVINKNKGYIKIKVYPFVYIIYIIKVKFKGGFMRKAKLIYNPNSGEKSIVNSLDFIISIYLKFYTVKKK